MVVGFGGGVVVGGAVVAVVAVVHGFGGVVVLVVVLVSMLLLLWLMLPALLLCLLPLLVLPSAHVKDHSKDHMTFSTCIFFKVLTLDPQTLPHLTWRHTLKTHPLEVRS